MEILDEKSFLQLLLLRKEKWLSVTTCPYSGSYGCGDFLSRTQPLNRLFS